MNENTPQTPTSEGTTPAPFAIDPDFAAAYPEAAQRITDQAQALTQRESALESLVAIERALNDPATAGQALRELVRFVSEHHGLATEGVFAAPAQPDTAQRLEALEAAQYAREVATPTLARLAADHAGFAVTPEQIAQAIARFPNLRRDPAAAVEAAFPRELARHYAEIATGKAPRLPDLFDGTDRKGARRLDPETAAYDDLVEQAFRYATG